MNATIEDRHFDVLIAEDDDDDYFIFKLTVEELSTNIHLSRAVDGHVLINMLSAHIPEILFLDLLMPRMDGFESLREIRKNSRYDNLIIIVISSVQRLQAAKFCFENRANRFIPKDGSLAALRSNLSFVFSNCLQKDNNPASFQDFVISNQ